MSDTLKTVNDRIKSETVRKTKSVFSTKNSKQNSYNHLIPYKYATVKVDLMNQQSSFGYYFWLLRRRNCLTATIKLTSDLHLKRMNVLIPRKMVAKGFRKIQFENKRINLEQQAACSTLKRILRAPLRGLQEIRIEFGGGFNGNFYVLVGILRQTNPKKLKIYRDSLIARTIALAGSQQRWSNICVLKLGGCALSPESAKLIAENTSWIGLEVLNLEGSLLADEGLIALSTNKSWINLKKLNLYYNRITDVGIIALASNSAWKQLEILNLSFNYISHAGVRYIARNVAWINIKEFNISSNPVTSAAIADLASNSIWVNLKELNLSSCRISEEGFGALGRNTAWKKLRTLNVGHNEITNTGKKLLEVIYNVSPLVQINY